MCRGIGVWISHYSDMHQMKTWVLWLLFDLCKCMRRNTTHQKWETRLAMWQSFQRPGLIRDANRLGRDDKWLHMCLYYLWFVSGCSRACIQQTAASRDTPMRRSHWQSPIYRRCERLTCWKVVATSREHFCTTPTASHAAVLQLTLVSTRP